MIGEKFGRWIVVGDYGRSASRAKILLCRCECGTEKPIPMQNLKSGRSKSCGCYRDEQSKTRKKHGLSRTPEHVAWRNMRARCKNLNRREWKNYGGSGIKVCDRWKTFDAFLADMGAKPSPTHSLDRIDPNGDYTAENCRWATTIEQANNKKTSLVVEWRGETKTMADWSRETGLGYFTLISRFKRGDRGDRLFRKKMVE